ncbi:MAG TPA: hypothetical protein VGC39_00225 [Candidatus Methylacidiphilales bacterium]
MNICTRHALFLVFGVSLTPMASLSAGTEVNASTLPALKLTAPAPRPDFYVKVDGGSEFFQPPKKDNSNFSETTNDGPTDGVNSLGRQSGDDVTWNIGGTFGYYLPFQPTEAWMGRNPRIEVSGNYFRTSNTQYSNLSVPNGDGASNFVSVGRLDGDYTGLNSSTDIGGIRGGLDPVAFETLTTKDEFYQAGGAFRSDYIFSPWRIVMSPKIGFEYSRLNQDFHTIAGGNRGSVDQTEKVTTDYFGPTFGLELKVQLTKVLVGFAEGNVSPFYASSDYSGSQFGQSTQFLGGSGQNSATDSKNVFGFRGGATTGFYCDLGPVKLKFGGGFEYWNYVATIQEAALPGGADGIAGTQPVFKIKPSHLTSNSMLNPTVDMTVILPF